MSAETSPVPPMPELPPRASSRRKRPFISGLAVGLAIGGLAVGGVMAVINDSSPQEPATASSSPSPEATTEAPQEIVETTPAEVFNEAATATDFTMTLKTTSKQCFGSAGCNITVQPNLSYSGLLPLNPGKTYSITYEVLGAEDGAVIQTMELSDQTSLTFRETVVSTTSKGVKLTAKVTDVEEQG
ncbi:hypothetical protein ACFUGD_03560 [Streptomyces sp. NPDC057217]|uniref:hypothetical protein n=1 Tax=Streptomyces sp. NPDC057217 TaxID=3346054 RepID=UPI0036375694